MRIDEISFKPQYWEPRSKPIDEAEFMANLHRFSEILSRDPIYRGIANRQHNFMLVNPATSAEPRRSRNVQNQYTLFMDNMQAWSAYPKRSQSIICSSAGHQAGGYGTLYRVLPVNGSKIAVARSADLWFSFSMFSKHEFKVNHFVDQLNELYTHVIGSYLSNTNFDEMIKQIQQLDSQLHADPSIMKKFQHWTPELIDMIEKNFNTPLVDTILTYMDPKTNGFQLFTTATYRESERHGSNEIWTDGPSYLIQSELFNRLEAQNAFK